MCAIGRALMARPKMILLDEPSMGLAPQIVEEIFEIVRDLNAKEDVSFLLAEQNTFLALKYASYGYILENGRVVMDGEAKALRENEDVKEFYLGIAEGKRKSFREASTTSAGSGGWLRPPRHGAAASNSSSWDGCRWPVGPGTTLAWSRVPTSASPTRQIRSVEVHFYTR